jgi:hypothetical protein
MGFRNTYSIDSSSRFRRSFADKFLTLCWKSERLQSDKTYIVQSVTLTETYDDYFKFFMTTFEVLAISLRQVRQKC